MNNEVDGQLLLTLCNDARQANGVASLRWSAQLAAVAQRHAQAMALDGYFDHVDRELRGVGERLNGDGYRYRWAGENISAGLDAVHAVFNWWMESSGHRTNILNPDFAETGMGYYWIAQDRQQLHHYWVQVFGTQLSD